MSEPLHFEDFITAAAISANDYSTVLADAIAQAVSLGRPLCVGPGTWPVNDVEIESTLELLCSPGTVFEAVGGTGAILVDTATGTVKHNVRIRGGNWTDCDYVLKRTNTSSLLRCIFEEMAIDASIAAFEMHSSIQNLWRDCSFGGSGHGVRFLASTQSNINELSGCRGQNKSAGWTVLAEGDGGPNNELRIVECWFEGNALGGIKLDGSNRNVLIESCYFESNGTGGTESDVTIDTPTGTQAREIVIRNCSFQTQSSAQSTAGIGRVRIDGQSMARVEENLFFLNSGAAAIDFAAVNVYHSSFLDNYVSGTGGGTYLSRLVNDTGTAEYTWSSFKSSGLVTDASPRLFQAGILRADRLQPVRVSPTKTAAYTATEGELVRADPSGGAFTVTLPASPMVGDRVIVKNITSSTNTLTIAGNGNTIEGAASTTITTARGVQELIFDGAGDWLAV